MSATTEESLAEPVKRGGVYHNVSGDCQKEILSKIIRNLPAFYCQKANTLLQAVMELEALISTDTG